MPVESWSEDNSRYLSAALNWLRLRLAQCANGDVPSVEERRESGRAVAADQVTAALQEVEHVESQMSAAPSLVSLGDLLGLSKFEQHLLLLCAAPEFDTGMPALYARAQGGVGRDAPTFALALRLFDDAAWEAMSPERPLRYWRLIEINQPGAQALTSSPLRADERIANYIKGLNHLDDRLTPYVAPLDHSDFAGGLPSSQQAVADGITARWRAQLGGPMPVVQLLGADRTSKRIVALHATAAMGRRLYRMSADAMPTQAADLELLARLWQRESALLPVGLYVEAQDSEANASSLQGAAVRRFLARADGLLMLGVRDAWAGLARETIACDTAKPSADEQRTTWLGILGAEHEAAAALLSSQFHLNVHDIRRIADMARVGQEPIDSVCQDELWDACRARVRPMLDTLAHRIDVKAAWDDIVLPKDEMRLLRQIAAQVRQRAKVYDDWGFARRMNRGLGITALFAGESGTGKTMGAEVIAADLRLNLYRIDLSAVVSKYIGETEKNLCRLFDAAEDGGAILFFDEADALFGKRSEVKDSHDRYANIEVNYLLQRMEAYSGLAILATNMRGALDVAFTRRLRFIVTFPFPSVADRRRMWQKAFPPQTPVEPLDYGRLARLNLTGGGITNAAVNAAFLAAESGTRVTMSSALAAARQELIKLDRPINEADFQWESASGVVA
jgi:hypothetical protein